MRSIAFRGSKIKSAGLVVIFCIPLGLGGVAVSAALSPDAGLGPMIVALVIGSGLIAAGLSCLYVVAFQLLRRGAIVTIDGEGILDVRNGLGLIPWADIRDLRLVRRRFRTGKQRGIYDIGIDLANPAPYLLRLPGWKRRLTTFGLRQGMPFAEISFLGLTPGVKEAVAYLRDMSRLKVPDEL